ncbi:MAG: hypothetical protein ACI4XQ_01355 [Eubacteriales bacterium]
MNLEEYTAEVKKEIRKRLRAEPEAELEEYILTLEKDGYIKDSYESSLDEEVAALTGCPANPNPSGFAYGIFMLYPDLPPKYSK